MVADLANAGQFNIAAGFFLYFALRAVENSFARLEMASGKAPLSAATLLPFLDEEVFAVFFDESASN